MKIKFKEEQKFTQWWIYLLLSIIAIPIIYGLIKQLIFKIPFGNNPMSDTVLILTSAFTLGLILFLLFVVKQKTEIDENEIICKLFANRKEL